jgi:thymidylate synthase (FAD)
MAHEVSPEAEALLDQEIQVLDHGFVRLVDYLGGDGRIVQSARVSYGEGTKSVREDKGLINYLMSHQHTSPFEQVVLTFHCKMPIFVARQWVRHRTARLNEISGRYSVMKEEFYVPDPGVIQAQSQANKQGRQNQDLPSELRQKVVDVLLADQTTTYAHYQSMLDDDIARELARINLPLSLYTEWYWQIDLHNLFHFVKLRMDPHAQWEIQEYGRALARCAKAVAPLAYEAFEENSLDAARFSRSELEALRDMLEGKSCPIPRGRKRREFFDRLGVVDPQGEISKPGSED